VSVETKKQSKQWRHTHSPNKQKKFRQTLSPYQKADSNCFLGQERSAAGEIHATRDHNNVRSASRNNKNNRRAVNKWRGMLTSDIVLLHDNGGPHTAARTPTLLEHFNWELFDQSPHDLAPSDYHLFTYLKKTGWNQRVSIIMG
jgi:hypothetical protein